MRLMGMLRAVRRGLFVFQGAASGLISYPSVKAKVLP
jgi:hypothetical protein